MKLTEHLPTSFIGHPYAAIGKGEEMRANIRALQFLDEAVEVLDVYGVEPKTDPDHCSLIEPIETRSLSGGSRVFHINGDEITAVIAHIEKRGNEIRGGRNIVVPAWELPRFPAAWVESLKFFDEIWAISKFVQEGLAAQGLKSHYVGQSLDIAIRPFLSRRYFGLRESAFLFLTSLDFSSYSARKNPLAAIEMFRQLLQSRPFDDLQFVLKVKGDELAGEELRSKISLPQDSYVVHNRKFSTFEQQSLMAICDCFVSLHRSEGFGRGPGEAMRLGRLALATGWSGNVDFMTDRNSLLAGYALIPVKSGEYPESEGQVWAEVDVTHAVKLARWAVDNPSDARQVSGRARYEVIREMGDRAVGLRMLNRLKQLHEGGGF